ncbi:hypothetical protein IQ235_06120 [Oscillatoriales cyanobacterium LEGE 11467]|uniref:Uncharacterized protein n=1 Tax=Zarconia navalis LEGE 11467 TaxID=1828826 RepID=A0A928VX48_9CYAN|nr:hypothetical protein [Zarconia navalis]MBE9040367.1 hypothetical protein [Zarconia navalis LEGE 11467]
MSRDLFARIALAQIPKILTLLDRNPHSPTYGCFDRNFWHYKIIDFPSGMSQEFVWPLALAYQTDVPENPFYQESSIRDWVEAGILYAARSAHADGSCDDYFPYERAAGASAFSLLACVESYQLLELDNKEALRFFERRADWLAHHEESGQLTNHQALIVLCLELVGRLLQTSKWKRAKLRRFERVLDWQRDEGWFPEYEGCDPGYHTLTLWCLARLERMRSPSDPRLKEALVKAVELASLFIHPDGSYGGEYSSRNTYNFFPHGFELAGRWIPKALAINDLFLQGLENGKAPCYADDHIIGHHTWNYLLAWQDFIEERPEPLPRPLGQIWLKEANLLVIRHPTVEIESAGEIGAKEVEEENERSEMPETTAISSEGAIVELYVSLNKGGTFKLFRDRQLVASDTHFSLQVRHGGKLKNAVGHLIANDKVSIEKNEIIIIGQLGWAKQQQMTPLKMMILRSVMLTGGRFFPNLIRKILQAMLITGKQDAPFHFTRTFRWEDGYWNISDELFSQSKSWKKVVSAGIGCAQTSIYIVMSRTFQLGQLLPWLDLTDRVKELSQGQSLRVDRKL